MSANDKRDLIKVSADDDLSVGSNLPWTVYDATGRLLMDAGMAISSQSRLNSIVASGYRMDETLQVQETASVIEHALPEPHLYAKDTNPFNELEEMCLEMEKAFAGILGDGAFKAGKLEKRLYETSSQIQGLCKLNADALLGSIHLSNKFNYSIKHPLHVAIISTIIAESLRLPQDHQLAIIGAAITANVAMNSYQDKLQKHRGPLTEEMSQKVKKHPEEGVQILKAAGITNRLWLDIVLQHHEKVDGSGYPAGLNGKQILLEAKIVGLADIYSAMVSSRPYRAALTPQRSLKQLFMQRGSFFDESLTKVFLSELGVFPPGATVELANGEIGVVVKRKSLDSGKPVVSSIKDRFGVRFMHPVMRDSAEKKFAIKKDVKVEQLGKINPSILWGLKLMRVS
ncbi:HD-GYP domain-containing protein [Oceanospirillum sediminis]|uniref:HD domain-containing protein n=1 Tax=Oceanospirillum sediminis TaxID=2760088 RepID=A0A839IQW1_9GAMM|nr:HD domain-containing phosphohydrolase [Oceanospirillum sediminis]MBB1486827.1 HD domain-containing protein [Oceanospirillum sediminis]